MSSAGDLRNPTSSRRSRRAHKGKAKEQETAPDAKQGTTEGTIAGPTLALNTLTESDDEWAWNTLANSAVNHRPAALTADGNYFFSITGTTVRIYSVVTGKVVSTLSSSSIGSSGTRVADGEGHTDVITAAIVNPQNPFQLLTASLDGDIKVWDYLEAALLQTIRIGQPVSHMCAHEKFKGQVFIAVLTKLKKSKSGDASTDKGNTMVYRVSLTPKPTSTSQTSKSSEIVRIGKTKAAVSMAVSSSGSWLVVIAGYKSYVSLTSSPESGFTKFVSPEKLTCLALHPLEDYFATGDERGQIRVWYCLSSQLVSNGGGGKRAQTTTMHWHAHAVSALTFTPNGAYLLSGGEENVLVIWQLHTGKKEFVPRLGASILAITVRQAKENEEEYLIGLADGSYLVVGAGSLSVTRSIPRIKLDTNGMGRPAHCPTPLATHYQSSTIILPSSHPSSLQIFSLESSSLVSELEVSASNRVSRRDEKALEASQVERVVVDRRGEWMATLDRRENDEEFNVEIFLKLWHWETNTWALNTRIDYPHGPHTVIAMSFCPSNAQGDLFMTAGSDGTVRTWSIRTVKSKDGRIEAFWTSRSTMSFRSEIPSDTTWSPDGSILAVSLQRQIALYDPQSSRVIDFLTTSEIRTTESVKFLGRSGRYLLVHGRNHAVLWDLITRSVRWHYRSPVEIAHVLAHPEEELILMIVQPYAQKGAARTSQVLHFTTSTSLSVASQTLPFRFRVVDWYNFNGESRSVIGITSSWNVVACGDGSNKVAGSITAVPKSIKHDTEAAPKKTLFRDIFGDTAFSAGEPLRGVQVVESRRTEGRKALAAIETPTYLLPPIDTFFSSLMDSFLDQQQPPLLPETKQDADGYDHEEPVVDADTSAPLPQMRTVDNREIEDLMRLFQNQVIDNPRPAKVNGFTNGSHKIKSNGIRASPSNNCPRSLPHVNGSVVNSAQEDILMSTVQKVDALSPSAIGKKRKKSTI